MQNLNIVLLNYNNYSDILECVEKLHSIGCSYGSIIVVDNHSTDNSLQELRMSLPKETDLIESPVNRGFGAGNNLGLVEVIRRNSKYVCVMNADIQFDYDFLSPLVQYIDSNEKIGIVGPCMKYSNGKVASCGGKINFYKGKSTFNYNGSEYLDRGPVECDYISGGCVVCKVDTLKKVGLIPESYFLNYEDNEWCIHFAKNGYRVVCLSSITVEHDGEETINKIGGLQRYFMARNRIVFEKRNASRFEKLIFGVYFFGVLSYSILKKDRRPIIQAYFDGLLGRNKYAYLIH